LCALTSLAHGVQAARIGIRGSSGASKPPGEAPMKRIALFSLGGTAVTLDTLAMKHELGRPFDRAALLWLLGALLLLAIWRWHHKLATAIALARSGSVTLMRYPSVTIVRPVRGCDIGEDANLHAALDTGYPGEVETLFVFDDEGDPGLAVARRVVDEHQRQHRPGRADVLIAGPPPAGRTGKLNAMIVGAQRARGELIAFGDSDTRPDQQVLRGVVAALLTTPRAGSAFAPVLVADPVRAAGDALYALMQNGMYSPLAAYIAGAERSLPFIMGQLMVFRRSALADIGGLRCAEGQLVDDMYLGKCLDAAGWKNVMSRHPLCIATGGMTFAEFIPVFRRWIMFANNGLPLSFTWRQYLSGVGFFSALLTALVGLALAGWAVALPSLVAFGASGASMLLLQRQYGGAPIPWRFAWTAWAVLLMAPVIVAANLLDHHVTWRGRQYRLAAHAALASETLRRSRRGKPT
jgi:ceramide glucosyltransferase